MTAAKRWRNEPQPPIISTVCTVRYYSVLYYTLVLRRRFGISTVRAQERETSFYLFSRSTDTEERRRRTLYAAAPRRDRDFFLFLGRIASYRMNGWRWCLFWWVLFGVGFVLIFLKGGGWTCRGVHARVLPAKKSSNSCPPFIIMVIIHFFAVRTFLRTYHTAKMERISGGRGLTMSVCLFGAPPIHFISSIHKYGICG